MILMVINRVRDVVHLYLLPRLAALYIFYITRIHIPIALSLLKAINVFK